MAARLVDFNALPKSVRERFIGSTKGVDSPAPLLSDEAAYKGAIFGWVCLALFGVATAYGTFAAGFGRRLQGGGAIAGYALGILCAVGAVFAIVRRMRVERALPWKSGRYLFPMDFIDARSGTLRLVPMNSLVDFRGVHHHTNGAYTATHLTFIFEGGLSETFVVRSRMVADRVLTELRASQANIQRAAAERDIETIFALDPFLEVRVEGKWDAKAASSIEDIQGPVARPLGHLANRGMLWGVAAAAGLFIGAPTWMIRDRLSDEAMLQDALKADTESQFEGYLERGGSRHASTVRSDLMPKAALREAVRKGTVTALRAFLARYPGSCVDGEAHDELHKVFAKTLADFRGEAADDPKLVPFMEKLVGFLEKNESSAVDVRFHSPSVGTLEVVDKLLQKKGGLDGLDLVGDGKLVPVSPHFDDQHSIPREAAIVKNLQAAFAAVFPADIMKLQAGKRVVVETTDEEKLTLLKPKLPAKPTKPGATTAAPPPSKPPLPAVTIPTLDVRYEVRWAGDIYREEKGNRKFVGIVVSFDVSMRVPNEADAYDFALEVQPPEHFSVEYSSPYGGGLGLGAGQPTEGQVYDVMAARAFDELTSKLRGVFFRAGSKANAPSPHKLEAADEDDEDELPHGTSL
jgi:hypothetical protein